MSTQNCTVEYPQWIPNYSGTSTWITYTYPVQSTEFPIQIRTVSNGYVCKINGIEYVALTQKDLFEVIKQHG